MSSSLSTSHFRPLHIPPLLAATSMGIGAVVPLWNPVAAIRAFGLPDRIATSPPAQAVFKVYGARSTCFGAAIWIFYLQGKLEAVDTILALQSYATVVDAWVCWREGVPRTALMRALAGVLVGGWGLLGLTQRFR
ncbi:uncharacterized protein A1O9_01257 [Exophiala aquamarina CBS 119918]|uniref:Uncharacterized protein n=1 Tax=Exophiala aquamarina CBS 119918 TaxID=1182545 RepID=A0A072Q5V8_9EURO|nr:uncharacterized protein A1O9_01257 [Exophiala aquamarina CBS 119918]KEF63280.1 hypothetical protein A1O9_01257 [Exophiala aquamarina CBS 119918]